MSVNHNTPPKIFLLKLDAQHRILISLVVSAILLMLIHNQYTAPAVALITWIAFALCIILMDWITIITSHPREVRKIARLQDSSRSILFLFVMVASIVSLLAIFFLLKSNKGQANGVTRHVLLAMVTVIVSWWLVHTVFTMRYAHLYYDTNTDSGDIKALGGLEFPNETEPDYLDFVYFSFVLGMTFQVSDVEISSRHIRRLAWIHGLISFAFNTTIVALTINIISGLI